MELLSFQENWRSDQSNGRIYTDLVPEIKYHTNVKENSSALGEINEIPSDIVNMTSRFTSLIGTDIF